jgi:hypothetical protein
MRINKFFTYIFLLITLLFSSCGEDAEEIIEDLNGPLGVVTKPSVGQKFSKGDLVLLSATFSDDKELKECSISLGYSGNKGASVVLPAWEPEAVVISLNNKEITITDRTLFGGAIPTEILTGEYSVTITITDKSGKSKSYVVDIVIE